MNESFDSLLKCIIIGDTKVGKSSFCRNMINKDIIIDHLTTIGVDFYVKILDLNNKKVKLCVWDTAGLERFNSITRSYYKGSNLIILMFDLNNTNSFYNLEKWIKIVNEECDDSAIKICLGNKNDLPINIDEWEIIEFCTKNKLNYYSTSSKYTNVNKIMSKIVSDLNIVNKESKKIY